jgi:hypothetical protein
LGRFWTAATKDRDSGRRALGAMVRGQDNEALERRFSEPRRGLAEWLCVSAGMQEAVTAMAGGRFSVESEVMLVARLEAMFGAA